MEDMEESMKQLTLISEKYRLEKDYLLQELKNTELSFNEAKSKLNEQSRLIQNVATHNKNQADRLKNIPDTAASTTRE